MSSIIYMYININLFFDQIRYWTSAGRLFKYCIRFAGRVTVVMGNGKSVLKARYLTNDFELVIRSAKKLEHLLTEHFNATGNGLGKAAISSVIIGLVQCQFSALWRHLLVCIPFAVLQLWHLCLHYWYTLEIRLVKIYQKCIQCILGLVLVDR